MATVRPGAFRVIAVNRSFELVPWAEVLYAADAGFWRHYANARAFDGWCYCGDEFVRYMAPNVHPVIIARDRFKRRLTEMIRDPIGTVGNGGNSGYQAVNLAAQFGARRILLAGLDYRGKHWHPDHPPVLRNPTDQAMIKWAGHLDAAADTLKSWGIEVFNLSRTSILKAYPYADSRMFDQDSRTLSA